MDHQRARHDFHDGIHFISAVEYIPVGKLKDPRVRVRTREGWCLTLKKKTVQYQDTVQTLCGYYVHLPFGFSLDEKITCEDCKKKIRA